MRRALLVLGFVALGFGVACLNYTADGKADHHREWARERGLPEPRAAIYHLGLLCTVGGAGTVGFLLGRPRRRT